MLSSFYINLILIFYCLSIPLFATRVSSQGNIGGTYDLGQGRTGEKIVSDELKTKMEKHAMGQALILSADSDSNAFIAKGLVDHMNEKFGKQWTCFVGKNFNYSGSETEHQNNSLISFTINETHFLLFKTHSESVVEDELTDMIERARNSSFTVIQEDDPETGIQLRVVIKSMLNNNFRNCQKTVKSVKPDDWCFNSISTAIYDGIKNNYRGWIWSVSVGKSNRCYNSSPIDKFQAVEKYFYLVNDMYFELIALHSMK